MQSDPENFEFNALRNALYHTAMRRTFETWSRWLNFLVVVLGAATISDLLTPYGIEAIHLGAATAIIGALQLTFDFGGRARLHQVLQRDYYKALADFQSIEAPTPADVAAAKAALSTTMADEPPTMRAVDTKAYNDALAATGYFPKDQRLRLPWWQLPLKNLISFDGYDYKKVGEIEQ
ncbi:hypothetical protein MHM88_05880 [Epibacterium sp. MM17-32]|uniref:hypothetical protein n=1 Tax=Epibacterium sp. MM17-32 TaxID=2917734 RepID=UPI001EF4548C|nr:hypothetical protein [Epibacterium sp. MM17-32]MCG7627327.1 hypothetical protein [Epibacterium sp. MM17-32]